MIEVDPEGDVILLPGNGSVGIRASSRVLGLASKRFEAMMGIDGKRPSKAEPAIVALPDDRLVAVTRLCQMLHFKCDDMAIDFKLFEQLALLCHKYDLGRAMRPWGNAWLKRFQESHRFAELNQWSLRLLYISYAFGDHTAFYRAYCEHILEGDADSVSGTGPQDEGDKDQHCPHCV